MSKAKMETVGKQQMTNRNVENVSIVINERRHIRQQCNYSIIIQNFGIRITQKNTFWSENYLNVKLLSNIREYGLN